MSYELEHPNLTAYALGQLQGEAQKKVEQLLAESEEARRRVEEIRAATRAVNETLQKQLDLELRPEQIEALRQRLAGGPGSASAASAPAAASAAPASAAPAADGLVDPAEATGPTAPAGSVRTATRGEAAGGGEPARPALFRVPSTRARRRPPIWAFAAAALVAAAGVTGAVLYRGMPAPVEVRTTEKRGAAEHELAALLRARQGRVDSTPVSVASRSFVFTDPRSPRAGLVPDAPLSLTTSDGTGLALLSLVGRAVIEEPLAFTELRLTFQNPEPRTREGRFQITLPPGASISRFAMKIGERWQEGEVVEKQAARAAYEDFLHRRQDPALLEQAQGNEFSARVFPIPPSGVKELIVSYSHELDRADEPYRLALAGLPEIGHVDIRVSGPDAQAPGGRGVRELVRSAWRPDADLLVPQAHAAGRLGLRDGNLVLARVSPVPDSAPDPVRSLAVLLDTSASHTLGYSARVRLVEKLAAGLAAGSGGDTPLLVVAFDQGAEVVFEGPARDYGAAQSQRLEGRAALGASDLGLALAQLRERGAGGRRYARVLLVSDGVATAGEVERAALVERARALATVEVERLDAIVTGGIHDRALLSALVTAGLPRDGTVSEEGLALDRLAARLSERTYSGVPVQIAGATWVWPETLNGIQAGDQVLVYAEVPADQPVRLALAGVPLSIEDRSLVRAERPLLERAAAKARIDRLLARMGREGEAALRPEVVELSVRHRVLSPYTALLVLETEADYQRYGIGRRGLSDLLLVENDRVSVLPRAPGGLLAARLGDGAPGPRNADKRPATRTAGALAAEDVRPSGKRDVARDESAPLGGAEVGEKGAGESDGELAQSDLAGADQPLSGPEQNALPARGHRASTRERAPPAAPAEQPGEAKKTPVLAPAAEPEGQAADSSAVREQAPPPAKPARPNDEPALGASDRAAQPPAAAQPAPSTPVPPASGAAPAAPAQPDPSPAVPPASMAHAGGPAAEEAPQAETERSSSAPAPALDDADEGARKAKVAPLGGTGSGVGGGGRGAALTPPDPEPRPSRRPPPGRSGRQGALGTRLDDPRSYGLTPAVVARTVSAIQPALTRCVAQHARGRLPGTIVLRVAVRPSGMVERVVRSSPAALLRAPIGQCLAQAMRGLRFPSFFGPPVELDVPVRAAPGRAQTFRPAYAGRFGEIMELLRRGGALDEARRRAEAWRTEAPGDVLALLALGETCEASGELGRAERVYGSLIDLFPGRADLRRYAGERLERLPGSGALALAEDTYAKAAKDRPDHPLGRRLHALALLKQGRVEDAFTGLEATLRDGARYRGVAAERFMSARPVLLDDLVLVGAVWAQREPGRAEQVRQRLAQLGSGEDRQASLRFVLNWETDANDVDLHVHDARGGHAYYGQLQLPSGGRHYGGVFTGYGPESVNVPLSRERRAHPYRVEVHYYARGPMGYGMGKVQIIEHDGAGNVRFDERPFVAMNDSALVDLGQVP